jgi:cytochrome c nitrite reductase small subunit
MHNRLAPTFDIRLVWLLAVAIGILLGVGVYTFVYARGSSYLTDKPEACINCHVMRSQHDGWVKGSHRSVAVCNDCHTPDGMIPKYASKAMYGFLHAYAFTTGRFPDNIQIKPHMYGLTERACLKCHAPIVEAMTVGHDYDRAERLSCIRCHRNVGHQ